MKRPSPVEWGCGLSLAVVIAVTIAATPASTADDTTPTQQCMTAQDAGATRPHDTGSCQAGSVQNP
jgi:hypothetical protein